MCPFCAVVIGDYSVLGSDLPRVLSGIPAHERESHRSGFLRVSGKKHVWIWLAEALVTGGDHWLLAALGLAVLLLSGFQPAKDDRFFACFEKKCRGSSQTVGNSLDTPRWAHEFVESERCAPNEATPTRLSLSRRAPLPVCRRQCSAMCAIRGEAASSMTRSPSSALLPFLWGRVPLLK